MRGCAGGGSGANVGQLELALLIVYVFAMLEVVECGTPPLEVAASSRRSCCCLFSYRRGRAYLDSVLVLPRVLQVTDSADRTLSRSQPSSRCHGRYTSFRFEWRA
ncbi:hypothetical protein BDW22DRAFT_1351943 [Trametopsis cervina]|nr:hypothetical protein BDW22DRAFT_1351943 [Trametopsis cervina]